MQILIYSFKIGSVLHSQWGDGEILAVKPQDGHIFYWFDNGKESRWVYQEVLEKYNAPNTASRFGGFFRKILSCLLAWFSAIRR
jgi:hypothetical protein